MLWKFMQNKKIIIFGDSFADPRQHSDKHDSIVAWYESLKSDYEVINIGVSGTGPHYSFKDYYHFINDNTYKDSEGKIHKGRHKEHLRRTPNHQVGDFELDYLENYIVIFLLSGEYRIAFPNANPDTITHINWDFDKKESWWCENENLNKEKIYYDSFKSEIDFFFLTQHEELKWSNFKNLGFLYMNSLLFNMKTIVFCTFGIKVLSLMSNHLDFSKLNNSNFYLHPHELGTIAYKEFIDYTSDGDPGFNDNRRNHFSQENHTVLYKNIKKMINGDYDNFIPFVTNIDYSYNLGEVNDKSRGKFIYE